VLTPGDDPLNDIDVTCSGPFEVVSYTPEQELVVQRNEGHWGEPAQLDKITFRFFPDDTTRVLALQNGEVDFITDVPQGILSSIEGQPGIKIQKSTVGNVTLIYVARRDAAGNPKLLADPQLRRAVAGAIDTEAFVNGVLGGNAEVVDHVSPPSVLGEFAGLVKGVDYDPAAAERLLDEAGWTRQGDGVRAKDGQLLVMSIVYQRVDLTVAEFVQSQLRAVGIDARVQQLDPGAYREALNAGSYDLDISQPSQNDANPAFLLALRWTLEGGGANTKILSPGPGTRYQELIEQTLVATDREELQRLAAEAMHELVDVEVGGIPLSGNYRIFAMKDDVQGVEVHPSGTNQRWASVYRTE
jgi:ABC-type transport system substrate-binding protein